MDERLPLCWCKKKPNKTRWNWGKMHFNNKISPQLTFLHYKCTSEVQQPGTENFVPNYINLATFGLEIVYCFHGGNETDWECRHSVGHSGRTVFFHGVAMFLFSLLCSMYFHYCFRGFFKCFSLSFSLVFWGYVVNSTSLNGVWSSLCLWREKLGGVLRSRGIDH